MWNVISLSDVVASAGLDRHTVVSVSPEAIEELRARARQSKPRPLSQREELILRERTVEDVAPEEPRLTAAS